MAVRVNDVTEFATLNRPAAGRLSQALCTVVAGSTVEIVSEITGPVAVPNAHRLWFVRVLDGACVGAGLSVPQSYLHDVRDSPTPAALLK